ncbi:MAG: hypothetical protein KJ687_10805 [Proteobacteria bacterium]|nr:hypothetical protein [Pseudomonadota bacterium]
MPELRRSRLHRPATPAAGQPIWFSGPRFLMDNDGVPLGYGGGRVGLAMYDSFTIRNKKRILWYPDRKFFMLGKEITEELPADLMVRK